MAKRSQPRSGSLQFWPRKRARKFLPSVNWNAIKTDSLMKGFISYKVGMSSALVKDSTPDSMTKDKKIILPVTILETPPMKIFSARFYKEKKIIGEILSSNIDKELKSKIKLPKNYAKNINSVKEYDNIKLIVYSQVKKAGFKRVPDISEISLSGSLDEKKKFAEEKLGKEILAGEILKENNLADIRGLTKGRGLSRPVKRFGIKLKQHKSEKGVRRPGSLGPWHPAHVTFRAPQAGQLGLFSRVQYNSKIIKIGRISEKDINPKQGFKHYGKINTDYIITSGSIPGAQKRALLLTSPLRPTKNQEKKKYEFLGLK